MVPTMPPFSWLGRSYFPDREKRTLGTCLMWGLAGKENIWDLLGEALMSGCSDVYITRDFASFSMLHLMHVFGESFEAGDLY